MRKCLIALGIAAGVAGCGSSSSNNSSSQTPAASTSTTITIQTATSSGSTYHPTIVPADFTTHITNPYWRLKPGATWTFDGTKDHVPEHVVITVAHDTKTILGVKCLVVHDLVTLNGSVEENTTDWYAQDRAGNIWYFGEDSKDYKNGVVISTQGTWESGVDGAQPGVVIHQHNPVRLAYRQEYRPGVAEDIARVITNTAVVHVTAGTFRNVVETLDTDPLNPQKVEHKYWALGVGPVHVIRVGSFHQEEIKLTSYKLQ
jgi:uncharacterized protein YceK